MKRQILKSVNRSLYLESAETQKRLYKSAFYSEQTRKVQKSALNLLSNALVANNSSSRLKNVCVVSGRSRGVFRQFQMSCFHFRLAGLKGLLNGVKKASW